MKRRVLSVILVVCMMFATGYTVTSALVAYSNEEVNLKQAYTTLTGRELADYLLSVEDAELLESVITHLTDVQLSSLENVLTIGEIESLDIRLAELTPIEENPEPTPDDVVEQPVETQEPPVVQNPTVNFTDAAPIIDVDEDEGDVEVMGKYNFGDGKFDELAENASGPDADGLELNKYIVNYDSATGSGTLALEAFTTGNVTTQITSVPLDIVLVIDQSGSMAQDFGTTYTYKPVFGTSYNSGRRYGFNDTRTTRHIRLDDGTYQQVTHAGRDGNYSSGFDYYYYTANNQRVYVYPLLNVTPTAQRQYNYDIVQFYTYGRTTKLDALKNSVTNFVNAVQNNAETTGTDHNIAIVGFASDGRTNEFGYYRNTELFVGGDSYTYNAGSTNNPGNQSSAQSHYSYALQDMTTAQGQANIAASINALAAEGATYTNLGIEMANGILDTIPSDPDSNRQKVVIVFTDGTPGWNSYEEPAANAAIAQAEIAKDAGATVYTIGIFDGANGTTPPSNYASDSNRFMHYVSSNYPDASSMSYPGTINPDLNGKSYYLSAGDADALNDVFISISEQIGGSTNTDVSTSTIVRDILSSSFVLPEGTVANGIQLFTANCTGKTGDTFTFGTQEPWNGGTVVIKEDAKTIDVTGFDFKENFVAVSDTGTPRGMKLIVWIPIELDRAGTFGGNNVPTNESIAGVYQPASGGNPETALEYFISPTVNVPIQYEIAKNDIVVYVTQSVDEPQTLIDYQAAFKPNGTNNANVDIVYTLKDGDTTVGTYTIAPGQTVGTWEKNNDSLSNLTDCKTLTLSCVVTSTGTGAGAYNASEVDNSHTTSAVSPNVHVLKPTVTFNDGFANLGQTNVSLPTPTTSWLDNNGHTPIGTPAGTVPTLSYTYDIITAHESLAVLSNAGLFTPIAQQKDYDVHIDVTSVIMNGSRNVIDYTTFEWATVAGCPDTQKPTDTSEFRMHVNTGELTIGKTGLSDIYDEQSVVFNVTGPVVWNGTSWVNGVFSVSITGNDDRTIYGLPIGTYTVVESDIWAWRYADTTGLTATLNSNNNMTNSISFSNTLNTNKWLSSGDTLNNHFVNNGVGEVEDNGAAANNSNSEPAILPEQQFGRPKHDDTDSEDGE